MRGVAASVEELDDMLSAVISEEWSVERLESILRAIMRCGAYELAHRQDVPPKVVISEYLAVADAFFGEKETGMTNGVLDKLAQILRPGELDGKGQRGAVAKPPHAGEFDLIARYFAPLAAQDAGGAGPLDDACT